MDYQYYPSPRQIAERAWTKFQNKNITRLCEPSVGKGDLLIAGIRNYARHDQVIVDVCEIDPQFHATIRDLPNKLKSASLHVEINIVGYDFMNLQNGSIYSHIIMNPPFSHGAKHVLKAFDLVWDAEIVAIINAETIRNPYSAERQRLLKLVEQYGSCEFVEGAFSTDDAERQTNVEVAIVYLRKQAELANDIFSNWIHDLKTDQEDMEKLGHEYNDDLSPALPNSEVENLVLMFNLAVKSMRESVFAEAKASHYQKLIGRTMAELQAKELREQPKELSAEQLSLTSWVRREIEKRYLDLKDRSWTSVLRSTNVTLRLSSKAQSRLESDFQTISKLEFTVSNIYGFLLGLIENESKIQMEMACDVFDAFITYHSDNTVYFKGYQGNPNMGWKSNDKHRRCGMRLRTTRIVHPKHRLSYHSFDRDTIQFLSDIDRVFAVLDGKVQPEISLVSLFTNHVDELRNAERLSSSYFDVRFYCGVGTIHLYPTNKLIVDRLNRFVGRHRQWLPPHDHDVNDHFWEQYDKAEKFDKDFRNLVSKSDLKRQYRDPLVCFISRDLNSEEHNNLDQVLSEALSQTLEKHGLSTEFQIGHDVKPDRSASKQELLFLAA